MRVAVVTTSYPAFLGDPAGHFVRSEARDLVRRGHSVVVFAPTSELQAREGPRLPSVRDRDEPDLCRVPGGGAFGTPGAAQRLGANPLRVAGAVRFLWLVKRAIERLGPFDEMVAHWLVPSGYPLAAGFRIPTEIVVHGSDVSLLERFPRAAARHVVKSLLAPHRRLRFVSHDLLERLERLSRLELRSRATVAPCAFDVAGIPAREAARSSLGITPSERLIVFSGRLVRDKRFEVGLAAAALIPDSSVVVVGGGPELGALSRQFPHARFTGELPRPLALTWLAAADVLVSTSLKEGAPTVVREARALGVDVVASPAGDLRQWAVADSGIEVVRGPR